MSRKKNWIEKRLAVCLKRYRKAAYDPEAGRNLAVALVEAGRAREAAELARDLLEREPNEASSWGVLAYTLKQKGGDRNRGEAERALRRALDLDPGYTWAARELSALLEERGARDEAEAVLREALANQGEDAETLFELALLSGRRGRFLEERELLEKALEARPLFSPAARALAASLAAEGDLEKARALLEEQVERDPLDSENLLELGKLAARTGDLEEAERLFRQALEQDPFSPLPPCTLAWFLCENGRSEEALRILEKRSAEEGEEPEVLGFLGRIRQERGELEEALQCYRRVLLLDPASAWVRREVWLLRIRRGQAREVLGEVLRRTLEPPGDPQDLGILAQAYLELGRVEAAVETLRRALLRDPFFSWGARELARLLHKEGKDEEALGVLEERIARGRPEVMDYGLLGEILREMGREEEAEVQLRKALELEPSNGWASRELVLLLGGKGRFREAEELALDRVRRSLADAFDFGVLGWLMERMGRNEEAMAWFQEALKRDPLYSFAIDRAVALLLNAGRAVEAEGLLRRSLESAPEDVHLLGRLAEVLLAREERGELEKTLRKALELDPGFSWAGCMLAENLWERGEREEAITILEGLLERDGKDSYAWGLLARVHLERDPVEAERLARKALAGDGGNEDAHRILVLSLGAQNRLDHALAQARKAQALFPGSRWPLVLETTLLLDLGEYLEAEDSARRLLDRGEEDPTAAKLLADALAGQGWPREALEVLQDALERHPRDPGLLEGAGRIHKQLGELDQAVRCLRLSLDKEGANPSLRVFLASLLQETGKGSRKEILGLLEEALPSLEDDGDRRAAAELLERLGASSKAGRVLLDSDHPSLRAWGSVLLLEGKDLPGARKALEGLPSDSPQVLLARALILRAEGRKGAAGLLWEACRKGLERPLPFWFRRRRTPLKLYLSFFFSLRSFVLFWEGAFLALRKRLGGLLPRS